jgi:hypothetical protein
LELQAQVAVPEVSEQVPWPLQVLVAQAGRHVPLLSLSWYPVAHEEQVEPVYPVLQVQVAVPVVSEQEPWPLHVLFEQTGRQVPSRLLS